MLTRRNNSSHGFTAVELVVVIVVFGILITATLVWVDHRRKEILREEVRSALRITSVRIPKSNSHSMFTSSQRPHIFWREPGGREEVALRMPYWSLREPLPVDLAFDVEFHLEETGEIIRGHPLVVAMDEYPEGTFSPRDSHTFAAGREGDVPMRIVLVPSRAAANSHASVTKYYDGPAITSNVVSATVTRFKESEANPTVLRVREMYTALTGIENPPASPEERATIIAGGFNEKLFDAIEGMTALNPYTRGDAARVDYHTPAADVAPALPFLIELLGDSGSSYPMSPSGKAAVALSEIGKPAIVPLVNALKHENPRIRSGAISPLNVMASIDNELHDTMAPLVVGPLIDLLGDEDPKIRDAAVTTLSLFHEDRTVEAVMRLLDDEKPMVRSMAAWTLIRYEDPRTVPRLLRVLREDPAARSHAAAALGRLADPEAVEPLIEALQDENVNVRGAAAQALGFLNDARAITPLVEALREDKASVGRRVAGALGELEAEEAIEALVQSLDSEDENLRKAAGTALEKITGLNHGENSKKWGQWLESRPTAN